jgi:uncharacterized protein (TIGR02453 family)
MKCVKWAAASDAGIAGMPDGRRGPPESRVKSACRAIAAVGSGVLERTPAPRFAPVTPEIAMSYFTAESLRFLKGLKRNNKKPWFEAHRAEYEHSIKEPMVELVGEMDVRLSRLAPEMTGDPKRSVFRIYRDVRFSKDKSPYKTHAACWFFHTGASSKVGRESDGGGAGFYFHLEPGASAVGGGCWMPPRPALQRFRKHIAEDPAGWERIVLAPALKKRLGGLSEESMLSRVPRGFDCEHPAGRWLRLQSFTVGRSLTDAQVTSARLTTTLADDFARMLPLVRWLNSTLGFAPAKER